jgi:hypothetical protein
VARCTSRPGARRFPCARRPQSAVNVTASLVEFFVNSVPAGKITRVDQGAPSSTAVRDALVPDLEAHEAAFVKQISREMT